MAVEATLLLYLLTLFGFLVVFPVLVLSQLVLGPNGYLTNVAREPLLDARRRVVTAPLLLYRDAEDVLSAALAERASLRLRFGRL